MIESTVNAFQLGTTGFCTCWSLVGALKSGKRPWLLLALASGVFFLGDLYWQLYLLFYGMTPPYSYIPYLSWNASYVFLFLLIQDVRGLRSRVPYSRVLWLAPLFSAGMFVFYMQRGDWIGNIVSSILMCLLLWYAGDCLFLWRNPNKRGKRPLAWILLGFCLIEYAVWTSSWFWVDDTLRNPYFWFDALLSVSFLLFPFALRKAVDA